MGYNAPHMDGDTYWHASERSEGLDDRCCGTGILDCRCGGDQCCCGNFGEVECYGCPDCERIDEEGDFYQGFCEEDDDAP